MTCFQYNLSHLQGRYLHVKPCQSICLRPSCLRVSFFLQLPDVQCDGAWPRVWSSAIISLLLRLCLSGLPGRPTPMGDTHLPVHPQEWAHTMILQRMVIKKGGATRCEGLYLNHRVGESHSPSTTGSMWGPRARGGQWRIWGGQERNKGQCVCALRLQFPSPVHICGKWS